MSELILNEIIAYEQAGLLMDDDIGLSLLSTSGCFDFRSTNVVQLSNWSPYFY